MSSKGIRKKFWDIFSMMRDTGVDYQVFLLVLIFFKKDILKQYLSGKEKDFHSFVLKKVQKLHKQERLILKEVSNRFEDDLRKFKSHHISFIQESLEQSDLSLESTFDQVLFLLSDVLGKKEGEHFQPDELSELMIKLADLKNQDEVYNPFAGLASFGTKLKSTNGYVGQEINSRTYFMAVLRLLAYNKLKISDFRLEDSVQNWLTDHKFDLVISSLPIGVKINKSLYKNIDSNTVEHFYLKETIKALKDTGKSIALISDGVLFRAGKEKQLREWLIENDFLETIISLPGNLLFNTPIASNLIILSKKKENKGYVKMLDASKMVEELENGPNKLIVKKVLDNYRSDENSEHVRIVTNKEVEKNDFNLSVSRYFAKNVAQQIHGVKLREIISPVKGHKVKNKSNTKYIKIGDLNDNSMGIYADLDTINLDSSERSGYQVNRSVLLLANRFHYLKPTILDSPNTNLVISNDIKAFEVNMSKVDIGYLVFELRKDYIQDQVVKYQTGTVMPYLSVDDLLNIKIKLPSKKDQRHFLLDEINRRAKSELSKYSKELSGMKADLFKEFSSTRHSVKQYLNSIRGAVNGLKKYITLHDGEKIDLNNLYSKNLNNTLNDHLQKLIDDTLSASQLLDRLENPFLEGTKEGLDLIELTEEAMGKFRGSKEFKYESYVDEASLSIDEQSEVRPIIEIDKEDFFRLFQNIVDNACNHGFESNSNNIIRVETSLINNGKSVLLEISNNGKPFDRKFTEERLKIRGEKSVNSESTGNGGADIDQIVKLYGGKFNLRLDPEKDFKVKYLIQFPIQIEGTE